VLRGPYAALVLPEATPTRAIPMTLYTEQVVVRGTVPTRLHRVTDILNLADSPYLILEDVLLEDLDAREAPVRAAYAQVNLDSILFAVSIQAVESNRRLHTPKVAERALVSVPPFRIIGDLHLVPASALRDGLAQLQARFIPVTDATFWSEHRNAVRQGAAMVAINHVRAQVFAPFQDDGGIPPRGRSLPASRIAWRGDEGDPGTA
jgi:hypothetical protein